MSGRTAPAPFAERLTRAQRMIARGAVDLPVHLADQIEAAGVEADVLATRMGSFLAASEPDRNWRLRRDGGMPDAGRALLLAAVLGCIPCCHLRRGGPQPSVARLALRQVDCQRCVGTLRRPPADEADRCDVCGSRGVVTFVPFSCRIGPTLVMGDACPACAAVLGIRQERAG